MTHLLNVVFGAGGGRQLMQLKERDDVGTLQPRDDARLGEKALELVQRPSVKAGRGKRLERDQPPKPRITGEVDRRKSPTPKRPLNPQMPELRARRQSIHLGSLG